MTLFLIFLIVVASIQIGVTMRSTASTGNILPRFFADIAIVFVAGCYLMKGGAA